MSETGWKILHRCTWANEREREKESLSSDTSRDCVYRLLRLVSPYQLTKPPSTIWKEREKKRKKKKKQITNRRKEQIRGNPIEKNFHKMEHGTGLSRRTFETKCLLSLSLSLSFASRGDLAEWANRQHRQRLLFAFGQSPRLFSFLIAIDCFYLLFSPFWLSSLSLFSFRRSFRYKSQFTLLFLPCLDPLAFAAPSSTLTFSSSSSFFRKSIWGEA